VLGVLSCACAVRVRTERVKRVVRAACLRFMGGFLW
jgi:hypothetical protein